MSGPADNVTLKNKEGKLRNFTWVKFTRTC